MITRTSPGNCANCGADEGLHHYETFQCPKNGIEEWRDGKKQEWQTTVFENSQWRKIADVGPVMLEALKAVNNYFIDLQNKCVLTASDERAWKQISSAIQKATE